MHNPIQMALARVYNNIPLQILDLAFKRSTWAGPIDQAIITKIIHGRILGDTNLVGGKVKEIPLLLSYHEMTAWGIPEATAYEGRYSLYRIPPEERDNLSISAISHLTYPSLVGGSTQVGMGYYGNTIGDITGEMLEGHTLSNSYNTPLAELVAGDMIRLTPSQHNHIDWILSVRLAYEPNFSNLNQSAILSFAKLVELATKAYIYNTLIIEIDTAHVIGGVEIGTIKQIVSEYAEAGKEYDELLVSGFQGSSALDPRRLSTILKHIL